MQGSDRSVRPGINKNTQTGVFVYSGWGARIRTMIKRTKISCPTIRRHPNGLGTNYIHIDIAVVIPGEALAEGTERHPKSIANYNNIRYVCNYFLFTPLTRMTFQ